MVGAEFGVRINEPGARYRHQSSEVDVEFEINARGLRAPEDYPYAKPGGVRRVVSLGDSFTVGYEVEVDELFSAVLEAGLRDRGVAVEVLNAGVSGYSNAEALLYFRRELVRYQPDAVLLSFYGNDLVDNVRSGLFRLEAGQLVQTADRYVPAGGLGNWLNTNPVFNWFSEHSNAFVLAKERATFLLKAGAVEENREHLEGEGKGNGADGDARLREQRRLAAAILTQLAEETRTLGIPLVLQSIPVPNRPQNPERLLELFPVEEFEPRPDVLWFPAKRVLDPLIGREKLYHERSHGHWTPLAHRLAGSALAEVFIEEVGWGSPAAAP